MFKMRIAAYFILLFCGIATLQPASAQAIAQTDRDEIAARVAAFDATMRKGDLAAVLDFIPPRLLRALAERAQVSESQLKAKAAAGVAEVFKTIKLVSFSMDVQEAIVGSTPQQARKYMLIPTQTLMELPDGRRLQTKSSTLALNDDGRWYLVRTDNPAQVVVLQEIYPDFIGIEFPSGATSLVD